ncbi:MAG: nucleotidyltransferase domain-containing protein [Rhodospirillales bacterium]
MTVHLDLQPHHIAIVRDILRAHLPAGTSVHVFGSRADGRARRYSDLDLALDAAHPLGLSLLGTIAEALSESDLPFKVDLLDVRATDPGFLARISADWVTLAL